MIAYHYCLLHGKEECLMGGEDGDYKSHGCRRGVQFTWRGPVVVRDAGVIIREVAAYLGIGR